MNAGATATLNTAVADDCELIAAVRLGHDAAFEELYRRYQPRIAVFVRRLVRDRGRAEDVTQEAFMSALRRIRQTDAQITFKPWIYEIARNAAIDVHRRSSRTEEVSIDTREGLGAADSRHLVARAAPDATALGRERFSNLRGALDELSEAHHRIIVMRELEGLSYREIGERMELSPTAVESTLFRARRRLEFEYGQLDTGRRCQAIGTVIGRLAEGLESGRDRRRLDRHARRCAACRFRARRLGVEPILEREGRARSRVAALLPLPAFVRRRLTGGDSSLSSSAAAGAQQTAAVVMPALPGAGQLAGRAVAVLAAAVVVGGGGATLGGVGPLAPNPHPRAGEQSGAREGGSRGESPGTRARGADGTPGERPTNGREAGGARGAQPGNGEPAGGDSPAGALPGLPSVAPTTPSAPAAPGAGPALPDADPPGVPPVGPAPDAGGLPRVPTAVAPGVSAPAAPSGDLPAAPAVQQAPSLP